MGYDTTFSGVLTFTKPLTFGQIDYINTFSRTRRVSRDVNKLKELYGGAYGFNGSYGLWGGYFARDDGFYGQKDDGTVTDSNSPPGQPSLWCHWIVDNMGTTLMWDGNERFYRYVAWLNYLIAHFFNVWDTQLNGTIKWQGEDDEDWGVIRVVNSQVTIVIES